MAGSAVLSVFMQVLLDKLSTAVLSEFKTLEGVQKGFENLSSMLYMIQSLLNDAEEKQLKDGLVRAWLAKLKDVAYDVDDLLDAYATKTDKANMRARARKQLSKKVHQSLSCISINKFTSLYKLARQIRNVQERLEKIGRERDALGLQILSGLDRAECTQRLQTSSLVDGLNVFGREEDKDNIVSLLLVDSETDASNVSVIPIVGMGGLGKTTVTQLVYNDSRIKEHFELRMWICVSENFDVRRLTMETIEAAAAENTSFSTNMNMLQENLEAMLRGKKYLLVLDDVWNEDMEKWHRYRAALIAGAKGSKIVVTTQNENVGRVMSGLPPYQLQRLSDNDCWLLFKSCAFNNENSAGYSRLQEIGKEIVKKLKGLPLAAKALGSLLYSKVNEEEWKSVLKSEMWELAPDKSVVLPALRLSYNYLPAHLKQCFAYCSVFPRDYILERDSLVQTWIAQGFIQVQGQKRLEDIGNIYFEELVSRSFFQSYKGNYMMHDAISDLAKVVAVDHCHRIEDDECSKVNKNIRHLSYTCDNSTLRFESFSTYKKLRTLLFFRGYNSINLHIPNQFFPKLQFLRVLYLHRRDLKKLPESIGELNQLRYLSLVGTSISSLPSSVSKLYNLQTLKLTDCNSLKELPKGITNLINLRHLEASKRLVTAISQIGNLTSLQELEEFVVGKNHGNKITELQDMRKLRGCLCIKNLKNVCSVEEATKAKMSTKECISMLDLIWEAGMDFNSQEQACEEVLEALQPHQELTALKIKGYPGAKFPKWLGSQLVCNLQSIQLLNFRSKHLPPLGQLSFLRYLDIGGANKIKRITKEFFGTGDVSGFPSLVELLIEDMPNLIEWQFSDCYQLFPCLTDLAIVDCQKLKELPNLPFGLKRLRISGAGLCFLPNIWGNEYSDLSSLYINDCPRLTSLRKGLMQHKLTKLEYLTIANCEELVSMPEECFLPLTSLRSLHIYNCPYLVPWTTQEEGFLPGSLEDIRFNSCYNISILLLQGLHKLSSLKHFEIADCPELDQFPPEGFPDSLEFLSIMDCEDLQCLPAQLSKVSSLRTLIIVNCCRIGCLPGEGLPKDLQELYIKACPRLKNQCSVGGQDWDKVAEIVNFEIDG